MLLEEMQARCKRTKNITQNDLDKVHELYCLLDFDKDTFCKIVDAIGIDAISARQTRWQRMLDAEDAQIAKEKYIANKRRLQEIETEKEQLTASVFNYEQHQEWSEKNR